MNRLSDAGSIPARSIVKTPYLRRFFFFVLHFVLHFPAKQHKNRLFYCFCMRCTVPDKTEKTTQFRGKPKLRGFLKMFRGGE